MFLFMLFLRLGEVGDCSLPLDGGVRVRPLLLHLTNGHPPVQDRLAVLHGHAWDQKHLTPGRYVKHCWILRGKGPVLEGPIFLGRSRRRSSSVVNNICC